MAKHTRKWHYFQSKTLRHWICGSSFFYVVQQSHFSLKHKYLTNFSLVLPFTHLYGTRLPEISVRKTFDTGAGKIWGENTLIRDTLAWNPCQETFDTGAGKFWGGNTRETKQEWELKPLLGRLSIQGSNCTHPGRKLLALILVRKIWGGNTGETKQEWKQGQTYKEMIPPSTKTLRHWVCRSSFLHVAQESHFYSMWDLDSHLNT